MAIKYRPFYTVFRLFPGLLIPALLAVCLAAGEGQAQNQDTAQVKIGVLAFRGIENARLRWVATADYLSENIKGSRFEIVPLGLEDMGKAIEAGKLDFVLTNTGNYVVHEARHGVTRIATMRSPRPVETGNVFGAVIFTRADRTDIQSIEDLKGKSFMAVERNGFGGFQMGWRELKNHGIDPFKDFSELTFSGFPQDDVALAVLNRKVDAATFRTNTLETMQSEGILDMKDFRILNPKSYPGFPFAVSTLLYPEWPFAKAKNTSQKLAQKVAIALLGMPENSQAAFQGNYGGWTVPLDYQPVHELFKELRIGPYKNLGDITFTDLAKQYGHWIVLVVVVLFLVVGWATWIEVLVNRRTRQLSDANAELERQIVERRKAEEEAHLRQAELAHVHRLNTLGEMASGFAHEVNQPLAAIANYARGCIRRIQKQQCNSEMILDTLDQVTAQAERAGQVIKRIRSFIRKEEPSRNQADINEVIRNSLQFVRTDTERRNITINLKLQDRLPKVEIDTIQIEQVILNLTRNAIDAMDETPHGQRSISLETSINDSMNSHDEITVSVADSGPGLGEHLNASDGDSLFDPFVTSKEKGLGLGLSISRSIIEAHGGRMRAVNSDGGGAVLYFTLPAAGTIKETPHE